MKRFMQGKNLIAKATLIISVFLLCATLAIGGQKNSGKKAKFPAPFGVRPGFLGNGARVTFAKSSGGIALPGQDTVLKSTDEKHLLVFGGNWDKQLSKSTDLYMEGTGKAIFSDGRVIELPILDPPTETFEQAKKLLSSEDFLKRSQGAWILGEIGDKRGIAVLKKHVEDPHWYVRKYIKQSLEFFKRTDNK